MYILDADLLGQAHGLQESGEPMGGGDFVPESKEAQEGSKTLRSDSDQKRREGHQTLKQSVAVLEEELNPNEDSKEEAQSRRIKGCTLIESQYILSTQVIEMQQKFERHENHNLKSTIV